MNRLFRRRETGESVDEKRSLRMRIKSFFTVDLLPKIFCLLAAFCLWIYVIDGESSMSEKEFHGVKIEFSQNENGLRVLSSDNVTVDVVLSGKRSVLNRMTASDIAATVDIEHITEASDEPLEVRVRTANDTSVVSWEPRSVRVYLDEPSSRTVSIRADYTGGTSDDSTLKIGELETSAKNVLVTGPLDIISKISYARAMVNLDSFISNSVSIANVQLELCDEDGRLIRELYPLEYSYIEIGSKSSDSRVNVYIPVYMVKELPVVPRFLYNLFDPDDLSYTARPSSITVRGDVGTVSALESVETSAIDDSQIGRSKTLQVNYLLPDGVTPVGATETCQMTLSVKNYTERTLTVSAEDVLFRNANPDIEVFLTSDVRVTVCGTADAVRALRENDLLLEVDAAGFTQAGIYSDCPVSVSIIDGDARGVYVADQKYTANASVERIRSGGANGAS